MNFLLCSTAVGNILGLISVLLGIISIFVTLKTMLTAKRLESEFQKRQSETLARIYYRNNKQEIIHSFEKILFPVMKQNTISVNKCGEALSALRKLNTYESMFLPIDLDRIIEARRAVSEISNKMREQADRSQYVNQFVDTISAVIAILNKGDYLI